MQRSVYPTTNITNNLDIVRKIRAKHVEISRTQQKASELAKSENGDERREAEELRYHALHTLGDELTALEAEWGRSDEAV